MTLLHANRKVYWKISSFKKKKNQAHFIRNHPNALHHFERNTIENKPHDRYQQQKSILTHAMREKVNITQRKANVLCALTYLFDFDRPKKFTRINAKTLIYDEIVANTALERANVRLAATHGFYFILSFFLLLFFSNWTGSNFNCKCAAESGEKIALL